MLEKHKSGVKNIVHFLKDIRHTGAVMPSSRYLAEDVVELLRQQLRDDQRKPVRVLELGAGTGTFTGYIHNQLRDDDLLDVVELNTKLFRILSRNFDGVANMNLFHQDVLEFDIDQPYDYVYSSIPYESIPSQITEQIWRKKLSLCRPGSIITYYKYLNFNHFRCKFEKKLVHKYGKDEKVVFMNVPPAKLFTLNISDPETALQIGGQKSRMVAS